MNNLKLQIFLSGSLLNEFDIEEDKTYTIGTAPNCAIPIFDENFPPQLLSFKNVGGFIAIQSKDKNTKFPPSLKLPTSFIYKEYRFSFKQVSHKNNYTNIVKLSCKKDRQNMLITYVTTLIIVIGTIIYFSFSYISSKNLEKRFNKDMGNLSKLIQSDKVLNESIVLLKKYKNTKYEKLLQQKVDELLKIKNEYISLLTRLKSNAIYRTNYQELFKLLRQKKKILAKIKWEPYKKEAEELLDKIRLKIIFIKHKAFLDLHKDIMEQIINERFVQAYTYYNNMLDKNKLITTKYKNVLKKKLDISLNKDKDGFEKELLTLINTQKLDEAENLIRIKINTYPSEYTQYFKGLLSQVLEAKNNTEEEKLEKEQENKYGIDKSQQNEEENKNHTNNSINNSEKEKEKEKEQSQQQKSQIINDKDILETIKQKNFNELKSIFENEKYKFNISSDVYYLAKTFINLEDNCTKKKPFEYAINKLKKTIVSCNIGIVRIKEKNITKDIKLKDMEWDDIYYIILKVEPDFENKVILLKFADRFDLDKNLPDLLGYLYVSETDKKEEVKNLVRTYINELKNKNPTWSADGKWISQEDLICSELDNLTKRKVAYNKILDYLSKINNDKSINLAEISNCKIETTNFLNYTISILKNQYNATIDNLFNLVNNEIDVLKKEVIKVIRSNDYLKSVQKKGEQVEWSPNAESSNKYQKFLDESNKYIDNILTNPWDSKTAKEKFKDLDKLMIVYKFFENIDKENLLNDFLKKWDQFWKPKWEQFTTKMFEALTKVDTINGRIFSNLKKNNQITDDEIECIKLVNKYRVKLGFNALIFNKKLYDGAGIHAKYLDSLATLQKKTKRELTLSHFQQNTDTIKPEDRAKKSGYKPNILGENIAYAPNENRNTAEWIVEGWRHSPYHHNGLITQGVIEIGCYKENLAWVLLIGSEK